MTDINASNSLPAEALSPELVTVERGYQKVRLPLRTETGTIVYVDLGYGEAAALAGRIGRLAHTAREHNESLPATRAAKEAEEAWPAKGSFAEKLCMMVWDARGHTWTEAQFAEGCHRLGYDVTLWDARGLMQELAEHGVLEEVEGGRFARVR